MSIRLWVTGALLLYTGFAHAANKIEKLETAEIVAFRYQGSVGRVSALKEGETYQYTLEVDGQVVDISAMSIKTPQEMFLRLEQRYHKQQKSDCRNVKHK